MRTAAFILALFLSPLLVISQVGISDSARERKYYSVEKVPLPDSVLLEVGGMDFMPDGKLAVCTRRGEIWLIEDPYSKNGKPKFTRFASGLHEPLGLSYYQGSIYVTQRSELTRITDKNGDGKADLFQTVTTWPISGNYHEYAYGPLILPNGDMLVNLNLSWVGRGASLTKWRGWMLRIKPDGSVIPNAAGMRSPAGLTLNSAGDVFFAENQGDWISSGRITHIEPGDFAGHPASLKWSQEPSSPLKELKLDMFPDSIGSLHEFGKKTAHFKEAAVIFPHTLMGISTSGIVSIKPQEFGPFKDQLLIGDQGHSKLMRAYLEKVKGKYQGACFPFLEGFASGILRMSWGADNSLFVGMTSRGWSATGKDLYGLQRVRWNGVMPLEIKTMKATSNGFELEFTKPASPAAANPALYKMTGFTYIYHKTYGSPEVDQKDCPVLKAVLSPDRLRVRLYVSGLREGYVHMLNMTGIKSATGENLLHEKAFYTLNAIPDGTPADKAEFAEMEKAGHHSMDMAGAKGGCGTNSEKNPTAQPAGWGKGPDIVIQIGTKPGLKFDLENFSVKAGSKVKLVFNNNDDMLHNLVITAPGKGMDVGKAAMDLGLRGADLGYVPDNTNVLFNTCLLQPEASQAIYFRAPAAGNYDYICSFPGHFVVMKGIMQVK